jgi:kynurenine 3-monooxygenase
LKKSVTVAGAGLAGSLMAIFLARQGYRVRLFEKRPDMRKEKLPAGRSINLALANRGLRALRAAGLEEQVRALLVTMRGRMVHGPDGHTELQPYGQRPWEVIYSVSRPGLNALLLDEAEAAGVRLHFRHPCVRVELDSAVMVFRDEAENRELEMPLRHCLAADGAGSVFREALVEKPGFHRTIDWLEHSYKELNIPASAEGGYRIEPNALHIWPRGGYMLIALPNLDGSFTVTLFLPDEGDPGFNTLNTRHAVREFFQDEFPDAARLIPDLEEAFFSNPTGPLGTVRSDPWFLNDQLCLLGDAAHAIVPFHGQGMNAAFEDCLEMDACLRETGDEWTDAFRSYFQRRKPNADAIADMAIENYREMRSSVIEPRFLLRKELAFELERRQPDRFIPRYSMVMFRDDISYSEARRRGEDQLRILDEFIEGKTCLADIDLDAAERRVLESLPPVHSDSDNPPA